ncbi:hypothetical protein J6590_076988 [Homalodisca vitripennis]|nr:hypothetical protein J6590_076988 [Homalodisca vitripennis]
MIGLFRVEEEKSRNIRHGARGTVRVTSETPLIAEQAGCLQRQDRLAVTNPSSSHNRRCQNK